MRSNKADVHQEGNTLARKLEEVDEGREEVVFGCCDESDMEKCELADELTVDAHVDSEKN